MWHAPIYGSQINQPAKLYKRFTASNNEQISGNVIKYNGKCYRSQFSLPYVEVSKKERSDYFAIESTLAPKGSLQIKYNGEYYGSENKFCEAEEQDLLLIRGELWSIKDIGKKRYTSLINLAVIYVNLNRVGKDKIEGGFN